MINNDEIWENLNKQSMTELADGNYGLYCNTRYNMGCFLLKEHKYKEALYFFCETFHYDCSLLDNSSKYLLNEKDSKTYLVELNNRVKEFFSNILYAPVLIKKIASIKDKINYSDKIFKNLIIENLQKNIPLLCLFTNEEVADIIICNINHNEEQLQKIHEVAKKRAFEKIEKLKEKYGYSDLDLNKITALDIFEEKYNL